MAWQRTIPFGYQMRQGRIVCNSEEADLVKDIFARYNRGESLQQIATAMTARGVRYHERTDSWNKNMVSRVLENGHYLGDDLYPRVVEEKDFLAVQMLRSGKNTYAPCKVRNEIKAKTICGHCGAKLIRMVKNRKTARWECENPDCGHTAHINDESLVAAVSALLDELAHTPESLAKRIPQEPVPGGSAQRIANELTNALNRGAESVEYLRTLVFACAAERYNELSDSSFQYKVDRLRQRLEGGETGETLREELLETAVRCIRITDADSIVLELVNGQMTATEAAEL